MTCPLTKPPHPCLPPPIFPSLLGLLSFHSFVGAQRAVLLIPSLSSILIARESALIPTLTLLLNWYLFYFALPQEDGGQQPPWSVAEALGRSGDSVTLSRQQCQLQYLPSSKTLKPATFLLHPSMSPHPCSFHSPPPPPREDLVALRAQILNQMEEIHYSYRTLKPPSPSPCFSGSSGHYLVPECTW